MNNQLSIRFRVVGVTYPNADGTSRQHIIADIRAGDYVELLRDPDNKFDKNAIAVFWNNRQIGYVPHEYTTRLALLIQGAYTAIVSAKLGGTNGYSRGVEIQVGNPVTRANWRSRYENSEPSMSELSGQPSWRELSGDGHPDDYGDQ